MLRAIASTKPATQSSLVRQLVDQALAVRADLVNGSRGELSRVADSLASTLGRDVPAEEAADVVAQAAACAAPVIAAASSLSTPWLDWLSGQSERWELFAIRQAKALSARYSALSACDASWNATAHLFEHFLHRYTPNSRKRGGVFFTPQPIADFIVRHVDRLVREDFSLQEGLADESVTILDPACGTGVFLLSVIEHLKGRCDLANVLQRMIGIEILPAAAMLAKLNMAVKLARLGCDLRQGPVIKIVIGDALFPDTQSKIQNPKSKPPVIIGNPPFASLSTTTNDWITRLVRGDDEVRGYLRANGQRLNERKTWLHDDYVKFIRLAQWHVEQAGCGIVGYITNHGFLDNATFRLMRQELFRVFPRIEIIDLHGNRKKLETSPDGCRDENVFGLDQGVAISFFSKGTGHREQGTGQIPKVSFAELWGSRDAKLQAISSNSLEFQASFQPAPADWSFIPGRRRRRYSEYETAWLLSDAMPVNTTAPVTARDHFVVGFTAEELGARIEQFRDLSIPDEAIRRRYFQRTRSARYEIGDTRSWKLAEARRIVAADTNWAAKIIRCLYRPFDWRYVFWHPAMIDWPRTEVARHLIDQSSSKFNVQSSKLRNSTLNFELETLNLCLIARRQQLPTQPCTFFWVSDGLALDGVIRSDNRGSESLFPLYVNC